MDTQHTPIPELAADPAWRSVDFVSDLHLHPGEPATAAAWARHLATTPADAVFILGDLFEAWPGDDCALAPGFAADCAAALREAAGHRALHFLHGNRDFLLGADFARLTGMKLMDDPTVLAFGATRVLLSHGDALCLDDTDYLRFRSQVRSPDWVAAFLARPLAEREAVAREMRAQSRARHREQPTHADVDADMARAWLRAADAQVLVHGHTHRPAAHDLGDGLRRLVLSDWDADATPPRLQALRLQADGRFARVPLG